VKSDPSITAYRINITTYAVSLLAERTARRIDLDAIWRRQRISDALADTVRLWASAIFKSLLEYAQRQTVHIDNILKSQACWEYILSLDLKIPSVVERELVSAVPQSGPSALKDGSSRSSEHFDSQDQNNVARCLELSAAQWMAIVTWGNGPGALSPLQLGVAATLASYAAQGWLRTPSPKQAKHGATMIAAAKSAEVLGG
jgi:hypothetical protein